MAGFKLIDTFLNADEAVNRLSAQATLLLRLRETAPVVLPETLARSSSIASHKQGKVVIFAENNAIAAKLRLYEPRLIDLWARQGLQVSLIKVEVQPPERSSGGKTRHAELSEAAAGALAALEATLPADSPLRQAVGTLSGRGRRRG
jgi:hypothetical protein